MAKIWDPISLWQRKGMLKRKVKLSTLFLELILIVSFLFFTFIGVNSQTLDPSQEKEKLHPRLSSILSTLEERHLEKAAVVPQFASERGIKIEDDNKIIVFIMFEKNNPLDLKALEGYGAEIIKGTDDVIKAKVPIGMLRTIADNVEGILFIDLPNKPNSSITSQGVNLTGASFYHPIGYTGVGVKVGIIDMGFANLDATIAAGELSNNVVRVDCTGTNCTQTYFSSETESHGTFVAQIVHDVAPAARLYLVKTDDSLDLVDAKNYCINNGIAIINHSVTYSNTNIYDGQCHFSNPVCTVNDAYEKGILWVNCAGNLAQRHYEAIFNDIDFDGWHNVSSENETITFSATAGDKIGIYLTWNAWPTTDQDYDLYLYFKGTTGLILVDSSRTAQTGTQTPTEQINIDAPNTGTYSISIRKNRASLNHFLELYSHTDAHKLTPTVASSSLGSPADAASVLSVAAINSNNWQTGPQEAFSSQGPTNDNRIKPDISGPDNVATYYQGYSSYSFSGTSAAAPHVAGLAAQIKQARPEWKADQIRYFLESNAIDIGGAEKDNIYGLGRVQFPRPIFNDVLLGYWAHDFIISIYMNQITAGCSTPYPLYCPDDLVNREQMATFIVKSIEGDPPTNYCDSGAPFPDVTADMWSCRFIKRLKELGITGGYPNGNYGPYDMVSREQMATFLIKGLWQEPPANYCNWGIPFKDVNASMWSCRYIKRLEELDITTGYGDGRYGPYDAVTRAQMAVFLWRAFLGI